MRRPSGGQPPVAQPGVAANPPARPDAPYRTQGQPGYGQPQPGYGQPSKGAISRRSQLPRRSCRSPGGATDRTTPGRRLRSQPGSRRASASTRAAAAIADRKRGAGRRSRQARSRQAARPWQHQPAQAGQRRAAARSRRQRSLDYLAALGHARRTSSISASATCSTQGLCAGRRDHEEFLRRNIRAIHWLPDSQWLGESYFQRQQYRDAAETFLGVTTKFDRSAEAPDALLRLGQSLAALKKKPPAPRSAK